MVEPQVKTLLVTGGAGFIGSAFAKIALEQKYKVIILDLLTYAGSPATLAQVRESGDFIFVQGDIGDSKIVTKIMEEHRPNGLVHFAAESHVDNSILGPAPFIQTNIVGTFSLLECCRSLLSNHQLPSDFRFLHVSTDEVFGSLGTDGKFSEKTSYAPNSPYSASKASSDHLVRAWNETFKIPTIITNCSNNYGPRQFPEKLIPKSILCGLRGEPIGVYGAGKNIRDWIHVEDHASGVMLAYQAGKTGETYCLGGRNEIQNLEVVQLICSLLDELSPLKHGKSYSDQITFIEDRKGHDFRYAIDDTKAESELGFQRKHLKFKDGLRSTIQWYLSNQKWLREVHDQ